MKQFQYKNYRQYQKAQIKANKIKIESCWAIEENIKYLCEWFKTNYPLATSLEWRILCHGVRRGLEIKWFEKYFNTRYVIGTDISPTAVQFEGVVHADFNKYNPELGNNHLIYSNSFDHAFDPKITIRNWMLSLLSSGFCVIEWSDKNEDNCKSSDPFSCSFKLLITKLTEWIFDLGFFQCSLDAPKVHDNGEIKWIKWIILRRN